MSFKEELDELYDKRDELNNKIEIERAERTRMGQRGSVQDVRVSQEREKRLKDELNEVNERIAELKSKQNGGMVSLGGDNQKDFINGIDDAAIIKNVMEGFDLNPNGSQKVEITTTTQVRVTDDLDDGYQNVQQYSNKTTKKVGYDHGHKVLEDKNAQIEFILRELKDGVEINMAVKKINVSLNDVNSWLEDGKNGKGIENIGFYEEVKQLESSSDSNEITIKAKKVEDTKKPKTPKDSNSSRSKKTNFLIKIDDERKLMDIVLDSLKNGASYDEAAAQANVSPNLIPKWRKKGLKKVSTNTSYFYNELRKIESDKNSLSTNTYSAIKRNKKQHSSTYRDSNVVSKDSQDNKLVHPSDIQGFDRKTSSDDKFVHPSDIQGFDRKTSSNDNFTYSSDVSNLDKNEAIKPKEDKSKLKTSNLNSRKSMMELISLMKKGHTRKQAAEKLGIEYNQVNEWYVSGLKNRETFTRNFFKQVKEIESKNGQKEHVKSNNKNKQKKNSSIKPFKPVRSLPVNKYTLNPEDATVRDNSVLKEMNKVLYFMRKGDSRIQASRKSNVNIGRINTWYSQGSKNHDEDTIYFYKEVKGIEYRKI